MVKSIWQHTNPMRKRGPRLRVGLGRRPIVSERMQVSTDRISEYLSQFSQTRTLMLDQLRRIHRRPGGSHRANPGRHLITRGHCLLVGVPGLAKTLMVSSISQILDVGFKRIQFTPDLMPSDINPGPPSLRTPKQAGREFRFGQGGRSLPISSLPTRSTARRRKPRLRFCKPCRNAR